MLTALVDVELGVAREAVLVPTRGIGARHLKRLSAEPEEGQRREVGDGLHAGRR
ncbi:MAG: hypothetical protein IPK07_03145 [Deltaproteobacteria bacterium]|nr:hypothetical protein [Deltaproteobacteria bacterium]